MWVFGYGSLMWDGWEKERGCVQRSIAELPGYVRAFNKLSTRNWGTPSLPGPTLNLIASASSCRGIAFEFGEAGRPDIVAYLSRREGDGFVLKELPISPGGDQAVTALVPIYQGRNIIPPTAVGEIAAMVLKAIGTSGSCASYVEGVANHLRQLGIEDPAVSDLHGALVKARTG